jgi:acetoin utilization protein AcuC
MLARPHFIASEIYRKSRYGAKHPLSIPRVSLAADLIRALGWLDEAVYRDGPVATPAQLARFHDPDYVDAVRRAERDGTLSEAERKRWNVGAGGNPIYGEVYRRPATAAGSSILAAEMLQAGGIVHSPAGGTHHGRPDRASGFCYFNDPVLAVLRLLDLGIAPVAYVDLDAHHGDGVEAAFADDPRVLTLSLHEEGLWPRTGTIERARTLTRAVNLPVPAGFQDDEFAYVLESAILPLVADHAPAAIVLQCGVDGLAEDPLSKLELSNASHWRAVDLLMPMAPRLLVLGGGGYNPYAVARAWSGVWARLNHLEMPERLPAEAEALLRAVPWRHSRARNAPEHWFTTLADRPRGGPVREEIRAMVRAALRESVLA